MDTPFVIDRLVSRLIAAWKTSGMSKRRLARQAGLHENTLRLFGNPAWQPRLETLRALERVLLQGPDDHTSLC